MATQPKDVATHPLAVATYSPAVATYSPAVATQLADVVRTLQRPLFLTINMSKLVPLGDVVTKYRNLSAIHRAPTLAVKLAQHVFWG